MSYSAQWACDGCDNVTTTPGPQPESLASASVKVSTGKTDTKPSQGSYHLCERCIAQLKTVSNPRNWSRAQQHQPRKWFGLSAS